ncbi:hypothetical protein GOP47_0011829 [Adiantum capillus-veneris]|uniref:Uncharacterized protein n=1 Tax=Adiantum capillus-veneris TaxID=13818 RepID=A0A9D4UTZ9_ADICA|nr:hypothetical protein GOP47_0011829 [Adiantum capillus-veneris]
MLLLVISMKEETGINKGTRYCLFMSSGERLWRRSPIGSANNSKRLGGVVGNEVKESEQRKMRDKRGDDKIRGRQGKKRRGT